MPFSKAGTIGPDGNWLRIEKLNLGSSTQAGRVFLFLVEAKSNSAKNCCIKTYCEDKDPPCAVGDKCSCVDKDASKCSGFAKKRASEANKVFGEVFGEGCKVIIRFEGGYRLNTEQYRVVAPPAWHEELGAALGAPLDAPLVASAIGGSLGYTEQVVIAQQVLFDWPLLDLMERLGEAPKALQQLKSKSAREASGSALLAVVCLLILHSRGWNPERGESKPRESDKPATEPKSGESEPATEWHSPLPNPSLADFHMAEKHGRVSLIELHDGNAEGVLSVDRALMLNDGGNAENAQQGVEKAVLGVRERIIVARGEGQRVEPKYGLSEEDVKNELVGVLEEMAKRKEVFYGTLPCASEEGAKRRKDIVEGFNRWLRPAQQAEDVKIETLELPSGATKEETRLVFYLGIFMRELEKIK